LRTEFQRDRDRIIHATAFRPARLQDAVFVNYEGDLYRTASRPSLEVRNPPAPLRARCV
jgi:dGTPase